MSWLRRLWNTLRPLRMEREIEREIRFHLAERAEQLRTEGLSDDEAMRTARLRFGNPLIQAERTREVNIANGIDALLRNVRYALRSIGRTPGFAATVIMTLAVAIGANSAVFSAIDAVLFEPLPFPDSDQLVRVRQVWEAETALAPARLDDWSHLNSTLESLTGYYVEDVTDTTGDLPERVRRAVVAPRFLAVLRVSPALGRNFTEAEQRFGGASAVLVSDRYWRTRLAADPAAPGRTIRLEGQPYAVVGVMPPSFIVPDRTVDLWWPFPVDAPVLRNSTQNRQLQWYTGLGRLAPGVTPEQAEADLAVVQARLGEQYPDTDAAVLGARVVPLKETLIGGVRGSLWLLFGAVSVLLLIACTNIAALLLSRAARREHEVALRFSLGASRAAVAGHLFTETALLALAGAAGGLLVAASTPAVIRALAPDLPRLEEIGIDGRILTYTMASALVVTLVCGLFPAMRGTRGAASLANGGRTQVSTGHSIQWLLVGVQLALSVTLLAGAGLLVRSVDALARIDPGFDARRVLAFRVSGSWRETEDMDRLLQRVNTTIDALAGLPGVESVATSWSVPGIPRQYPTEFDLVEGRAESEPPLMAEWRTVSPEYFGTLRIPRVAGEGCRRPANDQPPELMVNRSLVDRYFRGRTPVGQHLSWEGGSLSGRIVGIAADARELGIDRAPGPTVYTCHSAPNPFPWFLVRTQGESLAMASAVRLKLNELAPLRSVYDFAPLEARIGDAYAENRLRTVLLVLFAATALSLSCVGVYGTLSYAVSLRRREVGLRLALGALRSAVVRQLVGQGLRVVGLACVCGLALSLALARGLSGMLYGVSPFDLMTLGSVLGIVLAVGSLAAVIPAARAALAEPMCVLREQ